MRRCTLKMQELNSNVINYQTILKVASLSYSNHIYKKLIRWQSVWRKPFEPIKLIRPYLLMMIFCCFQFPQVSLHWVTKKWKYIRTILELTMNKIICWLHMHLVLHLFSNSHKGVKMLCWVRSNMLGPWKRFCSWIMVQWLHQ
jgi:hypothetical protein